MISTDISSCFSQTNQIDQINSNMAAAASKSTSWADAEDDEEFPISSEFGKISLLTNPPIKESSPPVIAWSGLLPSTIRGISLSPSSPAASTISDMSTTTEFSITSLASKFSETSKFITSDIRLADSDGDIRLFHYVHCDENSSDDIKSSRGIIRDGDDIVCKTFGYTPEISVADINQVNNNIHSFSSCKVYDAEEGATIRLWFDKRGDKWRISTHRKIDAYHSRWGNAMAQSFGDMFHLALVWECNFGLLKIKDFDTKNSSTLLKQYTDTLNKDVVYTFLVRNSSENRIVCDPSEHPQAYFIGSFDRSTHFLIEGNNSGFPMPTEHKFDTVEDLISFVSNIDSRKKQGVIVYLPNQKQVKIMNTTYIDFFNARGNEPSIKYRYLQIRGDQNMISMLYSLYPEYIPTFELYENILTDVSKKIYRSYVERYINRKYVNIPQQEFFILQACHGWHVEDKIHNKISLEKVTEVVDSQTSTSLNRLIKPYIIRPSGRSSHQQKE